MGISGRRKVYDPDFIPAVAKAYFLNNSEFRANKKTGMMVVFVNCCQPFKLLHERELIFMLKS